MHPIDRQQLPNLLRKSGVRRLRNLTLSVANGEQVPHEWSDDSYLTMLSKEGKAMRWLACSLLPEEYAKNIADRD